MSSSPLLTSERYVLRRSRSLVFTAPPLFCLSLSCREAVAALVHCRCSAASDLPAHVLERYLVAVAEGRLAVPIHRSYTLDEIVQAHTDMESNSATGKLVVTI